MWRAGAKAGSPWILHDICPPATTERPEWRTMVGMDISAFVATNMRSVGLSLLSSRKSLAAGGPKPKALIAPANAT